jgi:hypothetical protein
MYCRLTHKQSTHASDKGVTPISASPYKTFSDNSTGSVHHLGLFENNPKQISESRPGNQWRVNTALRTYLLVVQTEEDASTYLKQEDISFRNKANKQQSLHVVHYHGACICSSSSSLNLPTSSEHPDYDNSRHKIINIT